MEVFYVLIHHTEVKVYAAHVWVVCSCHNFQNIKTFVHVFKSLWEISASMVVQSKIWVAVSYHRAIASQQFFLNYYTFSLKLNCLQVVSKFVLDVCHFSDTTGYVWVHRTCDLHQNINCLAVIIEGLLKILFGMGISSLLHKHSWVFILHIDVLNDWEKVSNVLLIEWQVLIHKYFSIGWKFLSSLLTSLLALGWLSILWLINQIADSLL